MKFGVGSGIKVNFMPLALHELSIFTIFAKYIKVLIWR